MNEENKKLEDWRNEHGQPTFEYLQGLVEDGSIEALEKLQSIAEDLDVTHDIDTPADVLVERIRFASQNNTNFTP